MSLIIQHWERLASPPSAAVGSNLRESTSSMYQLGLHIPMGIHTLEMIKPKHSSWGTWRAFMHRYSVSFDHRIICITVWPRNNRASFGSLRCNTRAISKSMVAWCASAARLKAEAIRFRSCFACYSRSEAWDVITNDTVMIDHVCTWELLRIEKSKDFKCICIQMPSAGTHSPVLHRHLIDPEEAGAWNSAGLIVPWEGPQAA